MFRSLRRRLVASKQKLKYYLTKDTARLLFVDRGITQVLQKNIFSMILPVDTNAVWVVKTSQPDWMDVSIQENAVQVVASINYTWKKRVAEITITHRAAKRVKASDTIKIEQEPTTEDFILASDADLWLNYHQTACCFNLGARASWKVESDSDWLRVGQTNGEKGIHQLAFRLEPNTNKDRREGLLTFKSGDKIITQKIIQRGKKELEDVTHHIYMHRATFPVLYSAFQMLKEEKPSFLLDVRKTLNPDNVPSYVEVGAEPDFPFNMLDFIRKAEAQNPDAVYGFSSDDIRAKSFMLIFTRMGIDLSRVFVSLYSDGWGTYQSAFSDRFRRKGRGRKRYQAKSKELDKLLIDLLRNPSISTLETSDNKIDLGLDQGAPHIIAKWSNVRHFIQDKSYLLTDDPFVQEAIKQNNYVEKSPSDFLDELSQNEKMQYFAMTSFDIDKYKTILNETEKPNLIILGTNPSDGSAITPQDQQRCVKTIMDKYASTHEVFYKPHPSDSDYKNYESAYPGLKLLLPARMPFEVFVWSLLDDIDIIGGYQSSLFLTIPPEKIKFLFGLTKMRWLEPCLKLFEGRDDVLRLD